MPVHENVYYRNFFSCFSHPLWGLMLHALNVGHLRFVKDRMPEDLYQEADIFLSDPEWADKVDVVGKDRNRFCREWCRRIYKLAADLGLNPGLNFRREVPVSVLSSLPGEEADSELADLILSTHEFVKTANHNRGIRWVETHLEICRQAIIATGNGQAETEWKAFEGFLLGKNLIELQRLTGWSPANSIVDRLADCVERIRKQAGVAEVPLPPLPLFNAGADFTRRNMAKIAPRQRERININTSLSIEQIMEKWGVARSTAQKAKRRGWLCLPRKKTEPTSPSISRQVKIDTSLSISEIMARHGVSKATASRGKKRGWYCPGYHIPNPDVIKIMRETGCSRETARKMAAEAAMGSGKSCP